MILLEIQATPMWTDVVQAIGVCIGVPLTVWGIFKLFMKNKDTERKLSALEQLVKSQNEIVNKMQDQVDQLSIQSGQFQYQSSLMLDQNKLMEKQLELQTSIFLHGKGVEEQKSNIQKQKRLTEIRPYFFSLICSSGPAGFNLQLQNKGGHATKIRLLPINTDFVLLTPIPADTQIDSGRNLSIKGSPKPDKTYFNSFQVTFEANLEYEDVDGNKYQQNIQKLSSGQYIIREPIQISTDIPATNGGKLRDP